MMIIIIINNGSFNIFPRGGSSLLNYIIIRCKFSPFSLTENPPRDLQITAYKNVLLMRSVVQLYGVWLQIIFCSCVNEPHYSPSCDPTFREHGK